CFRINSSGSRKATTASASALLAGAGAGDIIIAYCPRSCVCETTKVYHRRITSIGGSADIFVFRPRPYGAESIGYPRGVAPHHLGSPREHRGSRQGFVDQQEIQAGS